MAIEVDGVELHETSRGSGAAWRWSSHGPDPIDYEIQWVENKDTFLYGTRVRPGGWNLSQLDPNTWVGDGTLEGARDMVKRGLPTLPR
ncbi:hypothetical protein ACFPK1_04275 [Actinomycetospora rhizophila]|uniref:Uncharacterized protein n=1 Tax=Actinomycetospora rhizophila TaxID=1416876 RepID=A0ABV9Z9S0_9PSEU